MDADLSCWSAITRHLGPLLARSTKSVLLLGPRQTGKSTLITSLAPDLTLNLAHEPTYLEFARNPRELEERLAVLPAGKAQHAVFVDEVQRLPSLLATVQALLDRPGNRLRFLLTGSSARKLRRGKANLLHVAGEWAGHHLDLSKLAAAAQVSRVRAAAAPAGRARPPSPRRASPRRDR